MIALAIKLTDGGSSIPEVGIIMPAEAAAERAPQETVFAQMCTSFMDGDGLA